MGIGNVGDPSRLCLRTFLNVCYRKQRKLFIQKSEQSGKESVPLVMEPTTSYTRRHSTLITDIIDEDGQLLDHQEVGVDILIKGSDNFFFTFAAQFQALLNLDGNEMKVLLWCAMNAGLNTNEIVLNKAIKQRLADFAGISIRSIDNALSKLHRKQMMLRVATGVYVINPDTTWKGKINMRAKSVNVFTRYVIEQEEPE